MKLGIVGTNFVASWLCRAARRLDALTLSALYSRSEESGRRFADKEGIASLYTDYDAFLASGIEAVYLASPTYCHVKMAKTALERGLSVLCEKPCVTTFSEWQMLTALANERGCLFMEAMRPAFDPALAFVKKALSEITPIRSATFDFCQYSSRYDAFLRGELLNAFTPEISGGAVYDIGIYPLFWAVTLFGEPLTVAAKSSYLANGFEAGGTALLGYDGFEVTVRYSKVASSVFPSHILGEWGSLTLGKVTSPEFVTLERRGMAQEAIFTPDECHEDNMLYELSTFVECVLHRQENPNCENEKMLYKTLDRLLDQVGYHPFSSC